MWQRINSCGKSLKRGGTDEKARQTADTLNCNPKLCVKSEVVDKLGTKIMYTEEKNRVPPKLTIVKARYT